MTDEKPTVIEALSKVMGDVQAIGKSPVTASRGTPSRAWMR